MELHHVWELAAGRRGVLFAKQGDVNTLQEVSRNVLIQEFLREGTSAGEAAAWLLSLAHFNACCDRTSIDWGTPFSPNSLLSFRGQLAHYNMLTPSLWRRSESERKESLHAAEWLRVALQVWNDENVAYPAMGESVPFWIDSLEVEAVAQHYGLGTALVDWSWDPMVALVFAVASCSLGEKAAVIIRDIDKDSREQVLLPPAYVTRLWRQRGLFQRHGDPGVLSQIASSYKNLATFAEARLSAESYLRIVFQPTPDEIEFARHLHEDLMRETSPLGELARWSIEVASTMCAIPRVSLRCAPTRKDLQEICDSHSLPPFPLHSTRSCGRVQPFEELTTILGYIDCLALRSVDGRLGYDVSALATFAEGYSMRGTLARAAAMQAAKLAAVLPVMEDPGYYRAAAKHGAPSVRYLDEELGP
jgi:hypothetical protein